MRSEPPVTPQERPSDAALGRSVKAWITLVHALDGLFEKNSNEAQRLAALAAPSEAARDKPLPEQHNRSATMKREAPAFVKGVRYTPYRRLLVHAGINMPPQRYVGVGCAAAIACGAAGALLGWFLAIGAALAAGYYILALYPEERVAVRKRRVLSQLPAFIDSVVAALSTGANLEAAITQASSAVPPGLLRDELERLCSAMQSGFPLRDAAMVLRERVPNREIVAMIVALSLFSSIGGTVLDPFQHLASMLRAQQQAAERVSRDLVMVKQSFFLLFALALAVPPVLMMIEPQYFSDASKLPATRLLLESGALGVVACAVVFRKMVNIRW